MSDREETIRQLEELGAREFLMMQVSETQQKVSGLLYLKKIVGLAGLLSVSHYAGLGAAGLLFYLYVGWKLASKTDSSRRELEYYLGIFFWLPMLFYGLLPDKWRIEK